MDLTRFKDTEKGILFSNLKKYKALSIYDTLDEESLNYVLDNMYSIKQDAIEITIDKNDKKLLKSVQDAGFKPNPKREVSAMAENSSIMLKTLQ